MAGRLPRHCTWPRLLDRKTVRRCSAPSTIAISRSGMTGAIVAIHLRRDPEPSGRSDRRQTLSPLNENGPPQAPARARDPLFNHARVAATPAGNPRRRLPGRLLAGDKHGATRRPQAHRTADPGWPGSASHYPSTTEQRDPRSRGRICPRMSDKGVTGSGAQRNRERAVAGSPLNGSDGTREADSLVRSQPSECRSCGDRFSGNPVGSGSRGQLRFGAHRSSGGPYLHIA